MKTKILIVIFICLLFIIPPFFYWYSLVNNKTISITNGSKYYEVKYNKTEEFEGDLQQWGMWDVNNVYMDVDGKYHTVKKIEISTTDVPQPYHYVEKPGTGGDYLFSSSEYVDDEGILHLKVYIGSPSIIPNTEEEVAQILFSAAVMRFADITHEGMDYGDVFQLFVDLKNKYRNMPEEMPFIVTKKEQ